MSSQHTAGPWHVTEGHKDRMLRVNAPARTHHEVAIAQICITGNSEAEANACLIAAVPDMLEALQACTHREDIMDDELGALIRAAIAKAEGR